MTTRTDTDEFPIGQEVLITELLPFSKTELEEYRKLFGKSQFGEWRKEGRIGLIKAVPPTAPNYRLVEHTSHNAGGEFSVYHILELEQHNSKILMEWANGAV